MVLLTKFHDVSSKIIDFLLLVKFWSSVISFGPVSSYFSTWFVYNFEKLVALCYLTGQAKATRGLIKNWENVSNLKRGKAICLGPAAKID